MSHFLQRKTRVVSKMSSRKFGEDGKLLEIVWKKRLSAVADFNSARSLKVWQINLREKSRSQPVIYPQIQISLQERYVGGKNIK